MNHNPLSCAPTDGDLSSASAPNLSPPWRVVCDFDGTVVPVDVTDTLLAAYAPGWESVENAWLAGEIGARQCMARQINLLHADWGEIENTLAGIELTPGFIDFADFCRQHNVPLTVVSDGMDLAITTILARHGMQDLPVVANRLHRLANRRYTLDFPYSHADCRSGVCKCQWFTPRQTNTLLIGDGHSDTCASQCATLTLAKRGQFLASHCRSQRLPYQEYDDFVQVQAIFNSLLEHAAHADDNTKAAIKRENDESDENKTTTAGA